MCDLPILRDLGSTDNKRSAAESSLAVGEIFIQWTNSWQSHNLLASSESVGLQSHFFASVNL